MHLRPQLRRAGAPQRPSLPQQLPQQRPAAAAAASRRAPRRRAVAPRAELTADRPVTLQQQQQQQQPHAAAAASACPFLAALPPPPTVRVPWHKRFGQLFSPRSFQQELLSGGDRVVFVPEQPGFVGFVMPSEPEVVREVFAGESYGTVAQARIPSFMKLMGEDSLIVVQDPKHKHLRGLLQPAFTKEAVASYLPEIERLVARHMAAWEAKGREGVKGYAGFKRMTFDFIIQVTFGRRYSDEEIDRLSEHYNTWTSGFLAWPWWDLPLTPFGRSMRARAALIEHFQAATAAARDAAAAGREVPGVIGALVAAVDEDGSRLTDSQICDNILLLLLAGHDTSSTTLTNMLSYLQDHPRVVQRLRDEQRDVVAAHGERLTAAALRDMEYADAAIRETLRVEPVVAGLTRVAARDLDVAGHRVAAGTTITLPLSHCAANDERWAGEEGELRPAAFVPERMLTDEGLRPGAQMPFGHGPRYCIGAGLAMAEMKVFIALLARHYSFAADNKTEWRQAIGRVPANGLPLVLTRLA